MRDEMLNVGLVTYVVFRCKIWCACQLDVIFDALAN